MDSAPDKQWKEPCYSGSVVTGRPADYAPKAPAGFLNDGSLLVGDDANSVIYRVTYTGGGK